MSKKNDGEKGKLDPERRYFFFMTRYFFNIVRFLLIDARAKIQPNVPFHFAEDMIALRMFVSINKNLDRAILLDERDKNGKRIGGYNYWEEMSQFVNTSFNERVRRYMPGHNNDPVFGIEIRNHHKEFELGISKILNYFSNDALQTHEGQTPPQCLLTDWQGNPLP